MGPRNLIIFTADLLQILYKGINEIANENDDNINRENHGMVQGGQAVRSWKPYIGIGLMVLGGAVVVLSRNKSFTVMPH